MARTKVHYGVSVLDLINAGMLKPGDEVTFEPRRGEFYRGEIGRNGQLIFGGQVFSRPSGAAAKLAGDSRNGWKEIKVRGRSLLEYRDQLLAGKRAEPPRSQVSVQPPDQPPPVAPPVPATRASLSELVTAHIQELTTVVSQRIADLSSSQFEHLVAELLARNGYTDVRRTGGPGDRNIDATATYAAPFVKVPIRVQVKHRQGAPNVGPTDVAAFRDRAGGPDCVLLMVTNAEFTPGAHETALEQGRQQVHLLDGKTLIATMLTEAIGVKEGPMGILEIDEDFWRQF